VKRTVAIVAGLAAAGVGALYLGSTLSAQGPAPAQAPAQTRIGVVNTIQILKSYHKFTTFQTELKGIAKPFEDEDKKLKENLKKWEDYGQQPNLAAADREKAEDAIQKHKREIQDNALRGRKALTKRTDEQLVQLYREIEDAVSRYAASNGFHLVLQYDDAAAEKYSAPNLQRKMNGIASTGCTGLMYSAPGLDLTGAVIANMNPPGAAGGPVPGPGKGN
jgi:Skp family chaperone for outer membrane proteins